MEGQENKYNKRYTTKVYSHSLLKGTTKSSIKENNIIKIDSKEWNQKSERKAPEYTGSQNHTDAKSSGTCHRELNNNII